MTQKERIELIKQAYALAQRLCDQAGSSGGRLLDDSRMEAAKQERQHRALGRRLVGSISKRASVDVCARLFACRGFATAPEGRAFTDRLDFVLAYGASVWCERLPTYRDTVAQIAAQIDGIDYVDLIGETK